MAMAANRPFGAQGYATSPSPTTASSLNYSQYGAGSFVSPSRNPSASISSSAFSAGNRAAGLGRSQQTGSGAGQDSLPRPAGHAKSSSGDGQKPERKESKEVARKHWAALREFLKEWLERESPTARASAREKLTRLTKLQFQELSTDVYDELMRRQDLESGSPDNLPFLPVRQDFHPKRNQARQKLATLPANRFKDLASDVFHELRRRYPEFENEAERYDEPPAPGPTSRRQRDGPTPPPMSQNRGQTVSTHKRQGSRNISAGSSISGQGGQGGQAGQGTLHRSRPSRDLALNGAYVQPSEPEPDTTSIAMAMTRPQSKDQDARLPYTNAAATKDVVIPNKSRMREEEEIQVPYARESVVERPLSAISASSRHSRSSSFERTAAAGAAAAAGGAGRRTPVGTGADREEIMTPQTADDREYYDRMSFSSNVTNKSRLPGQQTGWDPEMEKRIRSEYEFKIAGLERKIGVLEGEKGDAQKREKESAERQREWEDEVRGLKERAALHASNLRSLQHELDLAKDAAQAARGHNETSSRQAQSELSQWRERCETLEKQVQQHVTERGELQAANAQNASGEMVSELKREIHNLMDELNDLSARNEDLLIGRERDAQKINEMEARVEEYKRMYDAVRVELRNLKATSMMFTARPVTDDHLPASADGNIADVHVSAFQAAIDGMLTAARSSTPSGVLPAMKAIVEAITEIGEDVKAFEAHPNIDVDVSRLESLKHESTTRLNGLMQAARNHAMASGLSPVSLIDGAAGHLSANVIEIIKLLRIRRTDKTQLSRTRSNLSIKDMVDRSRGTTPTESAPPNSKSFANGGGASPQTEEHLSAPPRGYQQSMTRQYSSDSTEQAQAQAHQQHQTQQQGRQLQPRSPVAPEHTLDIRPNGGGLSNLRINSFQSSSSVARSDSFDLERNASLTSERPPPRVANRGMDYAPTLNMNGHGHGHGHGYSRTSEASETSASTSSGALAPVTADTTGGFRYASEPRVVQSNGPGLGPDHPTHDDTADTMHENQGSEQEWDDVKPYLDTQSSALVNSIQNLLAAIRTGGQTPALNEHLSEVIAISSSIVAVATNALPSSMRSEGSPLIKDLVENTNRLSEAQEQAKGGQFDKGIRQTIASASFGVAKSLKALMRLGKVA